MLLRINTVSALLSCALAGLPATAINAQDVQGPRPSSSQAVDSITGTSVSQLIDMATARNADLLAARQRLAEAQGILRQSGFRPNPSIDTTFNAGPAVGVGGPSEFSLGYNHVFELGGKRRLRIEVSERGLDLARWGIADFERQLRSDVSTRYAEALAASRNLALIEQQLRLSEETLRITDDRVRQGEAPALDQALLQVEVGRLESDRILYENQVQRAVLAIRPLIGLENDSPLRIGGDLIVRQLKVPLADLLARAMAERPDLQVARMDEQMREAEVRSARAEAIPNLVASGRYARTNDNLGLQGIAASGALAPIIDLDHTFTVGVSLNLPIRNRNQGLIQAAIARTEGTRFRRKFVEQVVAQEVRAAYTRHEAAQRALAVYDQTVLNKSRDNLRTIQAAFAAGELRLFDVINEQRRLTDTQRAYTEVLREAYASQIDLERAVGGTVQ